MATNGKIVLGILGAVAAGVVLGLLMAPEKGSEIRNRIKKTTGNWVDNLGQLFKGSHDGVRSSKEEYTGEMTP
ncbi:MAG: YtxH domain-containing protein [Bacteroidota bacterium]